jgi:hypothetical protein
MRILVIDNYDSFVFNLVQYLGQLGADCEVRRNDQISVAEVGAMGAAGILLSPGPGEPTRAEQVAIYEQASGRTVGDTAWYEVFAALRFATTAVLVMNRYDAQGVMPEGHTYWRDNPATQISWGLSYLRAKYGSPCGAYTRWQSRSPHWY